MNEGKGELIQMEPALTESGDPKTLIERYAQRPVTVAALCGSAASVILPFLTVIWKIDLCSYGPGEDFSGVFICILPFVTFGAAVGAIIGLIGKAFSRLLQNKTSIVRHQLIGTVSACVLATIAGLIISAVPAFMFAFPDC